MAKTLRYSRQREKIYEYLLASKQHPSAEMIHTDLRREIPDLSLGTVYRNLKLLEELGKIRKVTSLQGNERYDAICGGHVHFLCQKCDSILDVSTVDPDVIQKKLSLENGYRISKLDMMISGLCPRCSDALAT